MSMFKEVAITNRHLADPPLSEQIKRIVKQEKPDKLILREKDLSEKEYEKLAIESLKICEDNQIDCILHTYVGVAMGLNCKKIHLSLSNWGIDTKQLSYFDEIGVSVHSKEEAVLAQEKGATYLIAGHIFQTDCKKGVPPRGLPFLREICQLVSIPVYAIGGIKKEKIPSLIEVGASGACMMSHYMKL